jgi:hypothetical protein
VASQFKNDPSGTLSFVEFEKMAKALLDAPPWERTLPYDPYRERDMRDLKVDPTPESEKVSPPKKTRARLPLNGSEMKISGMDNYAEWVRIPHVVLEEEPQPYKGKQRVKMDVRLHQRQKEEAMSLEAQAFKLAVKRGLEKSLLKALDATAGMGFVKEDWEVLRQSLIDMITEQSRLYYRRDKFDPTMEDNVVIEFEIPKMTMSFRMPVDKSLIS